MTDIENVDPIELGFLLNYLERCSEVGAAKAWGAGKLFLKEYTLEQVEHTYSREWNGNGFLLTQKEMGTSLKTELDQAFNDYAQWIAQFLTVSKESDQGTGIA